VLWHDGQPFTADDVVFNWEYGADPATAATTIGIYQDIEVEKLDPLTVRVNFAKPTPFWANAFVGQGMHFSLVRSRLAVPVFQIPEIAPAPDCRRGPMPPMARRKYGMPLHLWLRPRNVD
jgi:hypothetical protein